MLFDFSAICVSWQKSCFNFTNKFTAGYKAWTLDTHFKLHFYQMHYPPPHNPYLELDKTMRPKDIFQADLVFSSSFHTKFIQKVLGWFQHGSFFLKLEHERLSFISCTMYNVHNNILYSVQHYNVYQGT